MNQAQIQELLSLGEGQRVEFKSTFKRVDALGKVICGFLNMAGGFLVCGVSDRGEVIGVDDSDGEISTLEKCIHDGLSPKAMVSFQVQSLDSRRVLVIEVPAGADVPYAFRNVIYIREAESTQKADAATIRDIVMRRQIEPERWERRFSLADLASEIAPDEIQSAVADALKVRRAFFRDPANVRMVLEDFSVSKYGRLTNGGDVLFTRNPAHRLPQARVRAMRYTSDRAGDTYRDMKSFEGPLHAVFEDAYSFIVRNTPTVARFIRSKTKREDSPIYPEDAVREALINALAHRDYSASSGGVSIHIYPRRLEIWNSGGLPGGVTVENLIEGHISVLRNPDIAHALYIRGLMEKAGRGSVLMIGRCQEQGLPAPVWTSNAKLGVTVTFRTPEVAPEVTPTVTPTVNPIVNFTVAPTVEPTVKLLLELLAREGDCGSGDIRSAFGLKDRGHVHKSYLQPALEAGLIAMTRPDKPTSRLQKYRLTAKGVGLKKRMGQREQV